MSEDEVPDTTFLSGGGQTGALIRALDWSATPLGPPQSWPTALKTLVSVVLGANQPMFVAWGPERTMIYNDDYAEILQDRHPAALGSPFDEVWHDIKDEVRPLFERTFAGEPCRQDDIGFKILRGGQLVEAHFSYSFTPVREDGGGVMGVYCACGEITERVIGERRARFMLKLERRLRGLWAAEEIIGIAAEEAGRALGAAQVGYAEITETGDYADNLRGWSDGTTPSLTERRLPVEDFGAHVAELREGKTVVIEDARTDPRTTSPGARAVHEAIQVEAVVVIPLMKYGRLAAWLYCTSPQPRSWTREEIALLSEVADRTWSAVERARAEAAMRKSEEQLAAVVEHAPVGIILAEAPSGRVLLANDQVDRIWGTPFIAPACIAEYGVFRALRAEDKTPLAPEDWPLARAIVNGENVTGEEIEFQRLDGVRRILSVNASPIRDAGGGVIAGVITVEDVTRRRATEDALRRLKDTLEGEVARRTAERDRMWKLSRDLMCVARADGKLLSVNPAWERVLGWTVEEIKARGAEAIEHPDDTRRIADELARVSAGLPSVNFEARLRRKDGGWRWISWSSEPAGELVYSVGRDITEDKEAREAVAAADAARREADAYYRAYFENSGEVLFGIGVLPDGRFTVTSGNPAHEAVTGVKIADRQGLPLEAQFSPEVAEVMSPPFRRAVETGQLQRYRETYDFGAGARHFDTVLVPLFEKDGTVTRLVGAARDVTVQVVAEDALRQSQKMEAVGQLTGGIAHDFNNLLGAVIGSLDIIQRKPDDVDRVREFSAVGLEAASRGVKLTRQLLAFSRAQRIELKPLVVANVVDEMRELLVRTLGPLVRLSFELTCPDAWVLSDPTQLEMALLNLAINARDSMLEGGELRIYARRLRIDEDAELAPGEYVELSVCDTGTGMPPEVAARAFDPFFTTKGPGKGTGLGLSQVYGVSRQSGGTARIESRPGTGTTVRMYLPVTEPPAAALPEAAAASLATAAPSSAVLVIDDDPDVRRVLTTSLDAIGYDVLEAPDGPSGLALLEERAPDLMLVDFAMPGMNGAEVAKAARARRPDLPIVFATGYADTDAIEQAVGPDAIVLQKPFRLDDLQAVLEEALAPTAH